MRSPTSVLASLLRQLDATPARGLARRLRLAVWACVLVGFAISWAIIWPRLTHDDVPLYHTIALGFWFGRPQFHTLPVQYPPLTVLPFSLTLVPPYGDVHLVFALWMLALAGLGYVGFRRFSSPVRALAYAVYLALATSLLFLARYDLVPALATLAAYWSSLRRRYLTAYLFLAAGILLKLYPVVLLPCLLIEQWRATAALPDPHRGSAARTLPWQRAAWPVFRDALICLGALAGVSLVALLLNPASVTSALSFNSDRPVQVESVQASLAWLATFFGVPARVDFSFTTFNYISSLAPLLGALSTAVLVAGCLWTYWRQAHGRVVLGKACLACLCLLLATAKVFSPQYLIWVLPMAAEVEGLDPCWLIIGILTTWAYPFLFRAQVARNVYVHGFSTEYLLVLAVRNALVVFATGRALSRRPVYESQAATETGGAHRNAERAAMAVSRLALRSVGEVPRERP